MITAGGAPLPLKPKGSEATTKYGALICTQCGTNLKTGKTHSSATKKRKKAVNNFPTQKNIGIIFRIAAIFVILIVAMIFLPKIINLAKNGI